MKREQEGGRLFILTTTNGKYQIEVQKLLGSYVNEDGEAIEHQIYFFHPERRSEFIKKKMAFKKHCCLVILYPEQRYGELKDVNTYHPPCFEIMEQTIPNTREGRRVVKTAIEYCRKYKESLGIDWLELGDNAIYYCYQIRRPKYSIKLSLSRQLLGQYPYYWRFGFRPILPVVEERIMYNIDKMATLPINYEISRGRDILRYLLEEIKLTGLLVDEIGAKYKICDSLVVFLRWLSSNYCEIYCGIYERLFFLLELQDPYSGVDSGWELVL